MFQHATIALAAAAAIVVGIGSGCATPAPTVRNYMTPDPTRNNQLGNADLKLVLDPTLGDKDVQCSMLAVEVPVNETLAFRRLTSDEMIMVQAGTGILTVDAKQIPVNPGTVVYIPGGSVQSLYNNGNVPLTYLSVIIPAYEAGECEFIEGN